MAVRPPAARLGPYIASMTPDGWLLTGIIFAAAVLYASVGHAGASGYLAAMALFGLPPAQMRPAALVLNILVAVVGTVRYGRAGCFSWRLFLPLAAASVPCAYVGGRLSLPGTVYRPVVGLVLLIAALRLAVHTPVGERAVTARPPLPGLLAAGGGIGLLSGLTGTGGGIFLSPLLLFLRWAGPRETAGVAVAFILVNSLAGLAGVLGHAPDLPDGLAVWAVAVVLGGLLGAELGSRWLGHGALRRLLAAVLVVAGLKMILS